MLRAPRVVDLLLKMVAVKLDTDGAGPYVERNQKLQEQRFGTVALPLYVLLAPDGAELGRVNRKVSEDEFVAFLQKAFPAGSGR